MTDRRQTPTAPRRGGRRLEDELLDDLRKTMREATAPVAKYLTAAQYATITGYKPWKVYEWIESGELRAEPRTSPTEQYFILYGEAWRHLQKLRPGLFVEKTL